MASTAEVQAMTDAIALAQQALCPPGPNPRVGCVILAPDGSQVSSGAHEGAGTPHAEVVALQAAGAAARGATAVVTLEPCSHTGRTGPCTEALLDAGVSRVVFAVCDPNPQAAGGAEALRAAGVDVEAGVLEAQAQQLNAGWGVAVSRGWPFVTLEIAASVGGKIAARGGTSRWITGEEAREEVHALRAQSGAVLVGIGTVLADDPVLTDRRPGASYQPIPVVVGRREVPAKSQLAAREPLQLRTHDLREALRELFAHGVTTVLVEGGPTIATQLLRDGLVDQVIWYIAPTVIGGGLPAVGDLGITTIAEVERFDVTSVTRVGADIRVDMAPPAKGIKGGGN